MQNKTIEKQCAIECDWRYACTSSYIMHPANDLPVQALFWAIRIYYFANIMLHHKSNYKKYNDRIEFSQF